MAGMFNQCNKLNEIKGLNNFITFKVISMELMFNSCNNLSFLDLTNFNTSKVKINEKYV